MRGRSAREPRVRELRSSSACLRDPELTLAPGFGASAIVYNGVFNVPGSSAGEWRECAVKVASAGSDLAQLAKEARLLGLCRHSNVLR